MQRRRLAWFSPSDSAQERRLLLKLDLLVTFYAFVVYWVKYLDQSNLNQAYVSGLARDLNFHGNQLVHLQTSYSLGSAIGQIPCSFLFPLVRINWLLPGLDILWGFFTLLQYRSNSYAELMAYRFIIGLCESAYYPGVHYVLGAWYRKGEISRRGGLFYLGLMVGTLTAGLIQGSASANLDGVYGLAGWRWMFILSACITLPIGILGFFIMPGTPDRASTLILSKQDVALARERLGQAGHSHETALPTLRSLKRMVSNVRIHMLVLLSIFFHSLALGSNSGSYVLWLKSLDRFSTPQVNNISTTAPAIGIFYVLFVCFGADLCFGRAGAIFAAASWNLLGLIILVIWHVPETAKWFAFNTLYAGNAMSAVMYGWANDLLKHDAQARAFGLVAMNTIAQLTTIWTPLLVYKTVEAPRFEKGYAFSAASAVCVMVMTLVLRRAQSRWEAAEGDSHTVSSADGSAGSADEHSMTGALLSTRKQRVDEARVEEM